MTQISVGGEEGGGADGVLALVVAVVEIVVEAMEREAVRRMDSGELTDEEIERLGAQLAALEEEIDRLKRETEVEEPVDDLRGQLDGLVGDALTSVQSGDLGTAAGPDQWFRTDREDAERAQDTVEELFR